MLPNLDGRKLLPGPFSAIRRSTLRQEMVK